MSDFDQAVAQYHLAVGEFLNRNPEPYKALFSRHEDVSVANPFAPLGPVSHGWSQVAETIERASLNYSDGEVTRFENVATYVTPDLAYIVEIERIKAKIGASDEVTDVALRATSIFRRENDEWRIVHRHADPITTPRPAESIVPK